MQQADSDAPGMSDTTKSVIVLVGLLLALPFLMLWLRDRVSRAAWWRRNPPEQLAADRRAYEERLLRPDWAFYEPHLQACSTTPACRMAWRKWARALR